MNIVIQMGRLTADPEIKTGSAGGKFATFTIAVDRKYAGDGGKKEADFHNVVAFNRKNGSQLADFAEKWLKKGKPVIIQGELQNRSWKTQQGEKRTRTEIVVNSISFLPGGKNDGGQSGGAARDEEAPEATAPEATAPTGDGEEDGSYDPWAQFAS